MSCDLIELVSVFNAVFDDMAKTQKKKRKMNPNDAAAEATQVYQEQLSRWANDVREGLATHDFFRVMIVQKKCRAPLDHFHLFMQKNSRSDTDPSTLSLLVWGKAAELHSDLKDLCDLDSWQDTISNIPQSLRAEYIDFIVSVTASQLADFEMRVMVPLQALDLQMLWLGKCDPHETDTDRVRVCRRLLEDDEAAMPLVPLKLRYLFSSELAYAVRSGGKLPTSLWLLMRSVCAAFKADTQDIESINSVIKDRGGKQTTKHCFPFV